LGAGARGGKSTPQKEPSGPDTADSSATRSHDVPSLTRRYQMKPECGMSCRPARLLHCPNPSDTPYALPTSMDIPGRMGPNSMCAHLVRWRSPAPERGSGASCSFSSRFFELPIRILRGLVGASYLNSRRQRRIRFLEPGPRQIRRQRRVT
jgi:hypothetical protein